MLVRVESVPCKFRRTRVEDPSLDKWRYQAGHLDHMPKGTDLLLFLDGLCKEVSLKCAKLGLRCETMKATFLVWQFKTANTDEKYVTCTIIRKSIKSGTLDKSLRQELMMLIGAWDS